MPGARRGLAVCLVAGWCLAVASLATAQTSPEPTPPVGADTQPAALAGADDADNPEGEHGTFDPAAIDPLSLITVVPGGPPSRTPMAVATPAHLGTGDDSAGLGGQMAEVLRRDFEMSGLFEVTAAETYGALVDLKRDGMTASTIDFDGWYNIGASVLVKGSYRIDGSHAEIDLRLFEIDAGRQITLNWSPTTVRVGTERRVVHDFVNAVIEHYTGERGVFGSRILFVGPDTGSFRRIHSIENDGYGLSTYDVPPAINVLPRWGPGGSVLFTSLRDEGDQIFMWDGEQTVQVTQLEAGWASGADYCPGKGLLVLTLSVDQNTDVYTMKIDGTEVTRLTSEDSVETSPSWGPGCGQIAFVSDRTGHPQIYVMHADGSDPRRLTWVGNYNTTPEWSPKGDVVAFTARDERRRFDIFTVNVSSGEILRLTQDQGNNEEPTWAPDGRYLAFQSTRDGRQPRLYVMTADGRWQTRISDNPGYRTPRWQR